MKVRRGHFHCPPDKKQVTRGHFHMPARRVKVTRGHLKVKRAMSPRLAARARASRRRGDAGRRGASGLRATPTAEAASEPPIPLSICKQLPNERRSPAVVRERENRHEIALA